MTRTKKLLWCIGSSAIILSQKYLIITNMVQIYIIHYIYVIKPAREARGPKGPVR